ncbi:MAG: nucleotidyltransferase family protein [Dehalococcoidia bacterium]
MGRHDAVMETLAQNMDAVRAFGVRELAVFGSTVRGEAQEGSDVDILVDFAGVPTFRQFMGLQCFLEDILGLPIDLADREALKPAFRPVIEKEARRVA